jgi:hypothetical protein
MFQRSRDSALKPAGTPLLSGGPGLPHERLPLERSPPCFEVVHSRAASASKRGLGRYFGDARAELAFAHRDVFVSGLLIVQALAFLATGATGAMLVVLAERHLQLEPAAFAWLIGAIGVGALLGPLIPNTVAHNYRDARWLFVPYVDPWCWRRAAGDLYRHRARLPAHTAVHRMFRSDARFSSGRKYPADQRPRLCRRWNFGCLLRRQVTSSSISTACSIAAASRSRPTGEGGTMRRLPRRGS